MRTNVSRYQAILRYFIDRPFTLEGTVCRTTNILSRPVGPEGETVRQDIAALISPDYARRADRERRTRLARAPAPGSAPGDLPVAPSIQADQDAARVLARLAAGGEPKAPTLGVSNIAAARPVSPEAIELRVLDSDSALEFAVFPTTFICNDCNRFYYLDPNGTTPIQCTFHAGVKPMLQQVAVVFSCARCAHMEPLLPPYRETGFGVLKCNEKHEIVLIREGRIGTWHWGCTGKNCGDPVNNPEEFDHEVKRACRLCHIKAGNAQLLAGETGASMMKPTAATAAEVANPLIISYVKDANGADIRLVNLQAQHQESADPNIFDLATVSAEARRRLERLGVTDFFSVSRIQSMLVNYGYRSRVNVTPDVPRHEQYPHFFQPQLRIPRFRAFVNKIEGRGLILAFDPTRLCGFRQPTTKPSYADLAAAELNLVRTAPLQEIVAPATNFAASTTLLHSFEHALRDAIINEIGLEHFDSRILVRDAAILVFETKDLGDGGIVQLAQEAGLMEGWLDRAVRQLTDCAQDCADACIACLRPDNASCHGFLHNEVKRWIPPNALLNRSLAVEWMTPNATSSAGR